MHDGMQYDPIQGKGHEPWKSEIRPFLKAITPIYNGGWQLPQILKLGHNT